MAIVDHRQKAVALIHTPQEKARLSAARARLGAGHTLCGSCHQEIDETTCWCGERIGDGKRHGEHDPVPMGCVCGYHIPGKTPDQYALAQRK